MKIGVIGSGNIGGTLGKLWANAGHEVVFGSRDPDSGKMKQLLTSINGQAKAARIDEAVAFGEVILIAVPWSVVGDITQQGRDWSGKVVIDATNRFGSDSPNSAAEDIAAMIPDAQVVKAFNAIGYNRLENPELDGQTADIFICGDQAEAKASVAELVRDIHFGVVDCGELSKAHLIESLAMLWISLSRTIGRDIAFKLLQNPG